VQYHWKGIGSFATVGLELALSVLVGLFGGRWLDTKLGTNGWLTLIGLGFGIATGYRFLWRALQRANQEAERQEEEDRKKRAAYHDEKHLGD